METMVVQVEDMGRSVRVLHVGAARYQPLPSWSYELPVWTGPIPDGQPHRAPRRGDLLGIFVDGATRYALAPAARGEGA